MKKTRIAIYAALCAVTALTVAPAGARDKKTEISRNLSTFAAIFRELQTTYVDTLDPTATMRTAIDAMLSQIDPYTEYYSEEEQDRLTSISSGEYAGIGSVIMKRDTAVVISDPYYDSPARRAGLRHGDILLAIDGVPLDRNTTTEWASSHLKGQPGTQVTLDIRRPWVDGVDTLQQLKVTRGTIALNPIPWYGFVNDSTGYINIETFSEKTAPAFAAALDSLDNGGKLKGLVIDLRDNGGGVVQSAVQILANFVARGTEAVSLRGRDGRTGKTYKTTRHPQYAGLPLVVLVDGGTASSSEILSGALQDLDRAVIIGTRTYGKGLVQTSRPLPSNGLMKLTSGRYYLPSGRLVQAVDYRRRNADGSAKRIPDSLTTAYKTRAGRIVRDGGGITPDITVDLPEGNSLLYSLGSGLWDFDFANKIANTADSIPDPAQWTADDSLFVEFKRFIDPEKLKYDRTTAAGIKYLRQAIEHEGYQSDSVNAAVNALEAMLHHDLERDLDLNRVVIKKILRAQLARRWYSPAWATRIDLQGDPVLAEALQVLADPRRYGAYLAPKPQD